MNSWLARLQKVVVPQRPRSIQNDPERPRTTSKIETKTQRQYLALLYPCALLYLEALKYHQYFSMLYRRKIAKLAETHLWNISYWRLPKDQDIICELRTTYNCIVEDWKKIP